MTDRDESTIPLRMIAPPEPGRADAGEGRDKETLCP
jgi:hypothetical protein